LFRCSPDNAIKCIATDYVLEIIHRKPYDFSGL
jgi:hypothetical protein